MSEPALKGVKQSIVPETGDQVEVEVKLRLIRCVTVVVEKVHALRPERPNESSGQVTGRLQEGSGVIRGEFVEVSHMATRDQKHVTSGHGQRVHEGHHRIVLVDHFGGSIAPGNGAERTDPRIIAKHDASMSGNSWDTESDAAAQGCGRPLTSKRGDKRS